MKHLSDSNYIFMNGLLHAGVNLYEMIVLAPFKDEGWNNLRKVVVEPIEYGRDYYDARLLYDRSSVESAIVKYNPDVIWTNNPIWVPFYLGSLRYLKKDIPIITYNHYIDLPGVMKNFGKSSLALLQSDGMLKADGVLTNSEWGRECILNGMNALGLVQKLTNIHVFPPSIISSIPPYSKEQDNFAVYNHRLSPTPYYSHAFELIIEIMRGVDIPLVFTNPSQKDQIRWLFPYQYEYYSDYQGYLEMLSKARFSLSCIFDEGATWSMSVIDAIACGVPTLIPAIKGYMTMVSKDYPWFYSSTSEAIDKITTLLKEEGDNSQRDYFRNHVLDEYGMKATRKRLETVIESVS